MLPKRLTDAAQEVARLTSQLHVKLVLAESCTAGLAAAALGGIPGCSCWLCGSAVVYRTETKVAWLDVDPPNFSPPENDSVGPQTAAALTEALLRNTPEADVAAAICGHLGPDAPAELDGRSFMRVLPSPTAVENFEHVDMATSFLSELTPNTDKIEFRFRRQVEAASVFLEQIAEFLRRLRRHDDGTHQRQNPVP